MNIFYEEDGDFKVASIISESDSSLQIETQHKKRSKIRRAQVLLNFSGDLGEFLAQASQLAEDIDLDLLWECAPEGEFSFLDMAKDYFGNQASVAENAACVMRLHLAPMYFYRKGRGNYKAAPAEALQAALAGLERKKREQAQIDAWILQLKNGEIPEAWREDMVTLLTRPDKNSLAFKALDAASRELGEAPMALIHARGGLPSIAKFLLAAFLSSHFAKGGAFPKFELPSFPADIFANLPQAKVRAFSLDDENTTEIDDAFSLQRLDDGCHRVGVHIAAPALWIDADSELEKIIFERLSTVYFPGDKITMLPPEVVALFTLDEGQMRPVMSIYFDYSPSFELLGAETKLETLAVECNFRNEKIAAFFQEDNIDLANDQFLQNCPPDFQFQYELIYLWQLAGKLQASREANRPVQATAPKTPRQEYDFKIHDNERVELVIRERGSPIDRLVSEWMIAANVFWGGFLAEHDTVGIYRTQQIGKVKMSTVASGHAGLGVPFYSWVTSPLRRAVDFVNQKQLISIVQQQAPRFARTDAMLFALLRNFDAAYTAYAQFEQQMDRYWCLRYIEQENLEEFVAIWVKDDRLRLESLPLSLTMSGLPSDLTAGARLLLQKVSVDLLQTQLNCRFIRVLQDEAA